jgi:hypothetical protein
MPTPKVVRIFISSPSDVRPERLIAARVIERLDREFAYHFRVEAVLWEREPLVATHHFQDIENIPPPRSTDVVVVILWSRLGVLLPQEQFRGAVSGRPVTGTEWEFEDALDAAHKGGVPHLMVYRKVLPVTATLDDDAALERQREQKRLVEAFMQRWFESADAQSFTSAFQSFRTQTEFEDQLYDHLHALLERRIETMAPAAGGEVAAIRWHQPPFRGLQSFEFEHAQVFFGRTRARNELRELLARQAAQDAAFLLVLGASGSGKSSLVKAGLLPDLMLPGMIGRVALCRHAVMRPSDRPEGVLAGLAAALMTAPALPELATLRYTPDRLAALLRDAPEQAVLPIEQGLAEAAKAAQLTEIAEARIAIVVDQLEELFTAEGLPEAEREAFVRALAVLARSGRAWVIATMRSDFFDRLDRVPGLANLAAGEARYLLAAPDEGEIRQMIVQPAREAGLRYEFDDRAGEGLADVIHAQAVRDRGTLPLLSFVLDQLWQRRSDNGVLTFEAYRDLGGLAGALGRRADEVFAAQPPQVQAALPTVLRALVTAGQGEQAAATARPVRLDRFGAGSPQRLLIDAFLAPAARLLVAETGDGGVPQLRIAHEALLTHWPKAREVLAEAMSDLKLRARIEQAAETWQSVAARDRHSFLLQSGRPLAEAEDLRRRLGGELSQDVLDFIGASSRTRRRAVRTRVAAAVALSGGIAASLVVGYYYGRDWLTYRQQRQVEAARTDLKGTTIAYSTSKGTVALDALPGESNSPYLSALLRLIPDRTLDLNSLLLKVNQDVITRTSAGTLFGPGSAQSAQIPEFQTTLNGAVFLHDPPKSRKTFILAIGIAEYRKVPALVTPTSDAQKFASAMQAMGYEVDLVLNPDHIQLATAAQTFETRIAAARNAPEAKLLPSSDPPTVHRGINTGPPSGPGSAPLVDSVAIVYISATGFEVGDQMLVAPTDLEPTNDKSFLQSMLSINDLVDRLRKLTAVQIVIVDTCRDDPFAPVAR